MGSPIAGDEINIFKILWHFFSSVEYYCQHLLTDLAARTSWSMLHLMWLMQLLYNWDCNLSSILLCFGCFWLLLVLVLSLLLHFILVYGLQLYMFVYHGMGFLLLLAPTIITELALYFGFKAQLDWHTSESLILFSKMLFSFRFRFSNLFMVAISTYFHRKCSTDVSETS
jgi:hypothetical protein